MARIASDRVPCAPTSRQPGTAIADLLRRACLGAALSALLGFATAQANQTPPPPDAGAQGQNQQGQNATSQNPQGPAPRMVVDTATDTIAFSMNEANGMEITEFIKWAQEVTGKRFVYTAGDLAAAAQGQGSNTISFLGTFRIKRSRFQEDFFAFFQTMLYIKSLALVPRGEGDLELLEIVSMSGARGREVTAGARYVPLDDIATYRYQAGVPILTTYQLKHINAQVVTTALRPFYAAAGSPQGGGSLNVNPIGNSSAMLMQGYGPQVHALVEILKLVDVPTEQPNIVVQVIPLEFQAPEELEPIMTEVLESRQRIRQQVLQEQGAGQPGALPGGSGQSQLKVVVHSSQKAVVLAGTAEQVRDAQELIAKLDVPSMPVDGAASVIQLKNVLAEDLADTLRNFLQEDNQAEQQAQAPTGAGAAAQRRTRRTVIRPHTESNSLLVSAAGTKWTQIQELIAKIDQRQRQVLIEAAIVELTTGDLDRLGVELGLFDLKENGDFTRGFGYTSYGQSQFEDTDDDGIPDTRLPDFDNPLQGVTGGIISGGDFAVPMLVNALSTDDRANILSLPSVLVNNNESATVKTGEERPTQQQNQGTATTQTGVGQPRNAGITLEISPTISPNNYLRLNVNLEVSRFVGAFDPNSVTGGGVALRRQIKTQVTMPSDSTMVIGGVIEDQESEQSGGIPLLKDIPILGYLFSKNESTKNKTNLYFFVTPTILDEPDFQDLYKLSLDRKLEAEEYIGERRLRVIDRKWKADPFAESRRLEDTGSTIEDLDAQGENETPTYRRTRPQATAPSAPTAPTTPGQPDGARGR